MAEKGDEVGRGVYVEKVPGVEAGEVLEGTEEFVATNSYMRTDLSARIYGVR